MHLSSPADIPMSSVDPGEVDQRRNVSLPPGIDLDVSHVEMMTGSGSPLKNGTRSNYLWWSDWKGSVLKIGFE